MVRTRILQCTPPLTCVAFTLTLFQLYVKQNVTCQQSKMISCIPSFCKQLHSITTFYSGGGVRSLSARLFSCMVAGSSNFDAHSQQSVNSSFESADMDPVQNTVEDLMLRICHNESVDSSKGVCLFTADGMPLTDDPFFNTCQLRNKILVYLKRLKWICRITELLCLIFLACRVFKWQTH